ncbi:unnamed protein product [Bemisia tabaci]|uniref:Proteasome activator complex subunit 4 n=1 Tax=Bemisia tabaci TaxID=7038 RepID=A0A9P0F1Z9_BEMTA|nr:unnamed protein product [Bemisia tabaci]
MENSDEKSFLELRTQQLGFRPQKEIPFNKYLPYADELDAESEQYLAEIKANLARAIMLREMEPGIDIWSFRLEKYIGLYGFKFSKEDHVAFIKVFYELLMIPDLEHAYIQTFCKTLILLLKKPKLISPDDLVLPWKPLYDLCERLLSNSAVIVGMYRYLSVQQRRTLRSVKQLLGELVQFTGPKTLEGYLTELVYMAALYFPPEATQEMLDLWRPKLCPFDGDSITDTIEYCEWFLPTMLRPDQSHLGYELWFHEFMNLWDRCNNSLKWDQEMMSLMTGLAENNIGYIDWEPYIPTMFTRFLRSLHLPVYYRQVTTGRYPNISMDLIARWIVSVLGGGSSAQTYLNQLMKALESYFHPANFGRWIRNLKEFVKVLPSCFIKRLHRERIKKPTWETPIPDSHKLTEEDITNFVESLKPTVLRAMFSKMNMSDVSSAVKHLSILRPELIVPAVIDRFYATIDSLTEPHKFTAAMNGVAAVARQLVTGGEGAYPQGPTHVVPILFATLPGIDPNDVKKSFFTFQLISTFSIMVPFVDCSAASQYHDLTPEEEIVCSSTAQFEDFVLQFMDRCFTLIESFALEATRLDRKSADRRSRMEAGVEQGLASTFGSILHQTSDEIFAAALSKLKSFVTSSILEVKVAGKYLATLCHLFAYIRPHETLESLLPHVCNSIIRLTESDETLKEETLDDELMYYLLLLPQISSVKCGALIKYKDLLIKVLDRTLKLKCSDGYGFSCTLLVNVLQGAINIGPTEFRCIIEDFRSKPLSEFLPIKHWGKSTSYQRLKINWNRPGIEEKNFVEFITHRYLPTELERLNQFIDGKITLDKEELKRCLTIVFSISVGNPLLPCWKDEEPLNLKESCSSLSPWDVKTGLSGLEVTMPNGDNALKTIASTVLRLQDKLLDSCEDDTQSLFVLIGIYDVLLFGLYRIKNDIDNHFRMYITIKKQLDNRLSKGKGHLRYLLIERVAFQHRYRQIYSSPVFTETHQRILSKLVTLATSRYSQVRIMSQSKVFQTLEYYQYSYLTIIPELKRLLSLDPNQYHEQFKGSLHLLLGDKTDRPLIVKYDWEVLLAVWPTIVQTIPSEKLSVIHLLERLTDVVRKNFPTIGITQEIPDSCIAPAAQLVTASKPLPSIKLPSEEEIKIGSKKLSEQNERNKKNYFALLHSLNELINTRSLHWRFHSMALSFLRDLVHLDENYPAEVVSTFLNNLIHDQLDLRKIAIRCVIFVLQQQKRSRVKITVDPYKISGVEKPSSRVVPGNREDNKWLTYCPENIPKNAEEWDQSRYVHKHYFGYYSWPTEVKVSAPYKDQPPLDRKPEDLNPCERKIFEFFNDPNFVAKLVEFLSLEERKGKDKFDALKFSLFKGLFRNYGDTFLEHFKPHIERLVSDKQESSQRCGAEMITGLIRGSIHWPYEKVANLWVWLKPTLRTALSNMTVETVNDWGVCFATSSESRDPNKLHWLIELLLEDPIPEEASFIICGRLTALQGVLNQQSWRVCHAYHQLLEIVKKYLTHEFQNVRDRLGSVLSNIFSTDLRLQDESNSNAPQIDQFLAEFIPQIGVLSSVALQSDAVVSEAMDVDEPGEGSSQIKEEPRAAENHVLDDKQKDAKLRLFKTICKGTLSTLCLAPYGIRPIYMELFPLLCLMENYENDDEMKKVCKALIAFLSQTCLPADCVPSAINAIEKVFNSGSWSAKLVSLDFTQVFIFHNMALIISNPLWIKQVSEMVEKLLENERVEVREKAGEVLSGLLHCGFISNPTDLLARFKKVCKTSLRKKSNLSVKAGNNIDHNLIAKKHAGVLGLCAFIRASPYDIPEHLPEIILLLGDHLSDPQPIPATIRKTLGDFKRTHHDDWDTHKTKFTEEELLIISDLAIPPSYFA